MGKPKKRISRIFVTISSGIVVDVKHRGLEFPVELVVRDYDTQMGNPRTGQVVYKQDVYKLGKRKEVV